MSEVNPRAKIGGNNPPTPFDEIASEINDLYDEAELWLDGEPIDSQPKADDLANLREMIRDAGKRAEELRKKEAKPFDDGKAEVQARYAPLIAETKAMTGKVPAALSACGKALAPWLERLEREKREEAEKARQEAEAKQRAALEAMQAADRANLAEMQAAEAAIKDAKRAERSANAAEKDKAAAGSIGRSAHLRTVKTSEITDDQEFARHVWVSYHAELKEFLISFAQKLVLRGVTDIPGVEIREEKKVVG